MEIKGDKFWVSVCGIWGDILDKFLEFRCPYFLKNNLPKFTKKNVPIYKEKCGYSTKKNLLKFEKKSFF
jgi:hypothetical protein